MWIVSTMAAEASIRNNNYENRQTLLCLSVFFEKWKNVYFQFIFLV